MSGIRRRRARRPWRLAAIVAAGALALATLAAAPPARAAAWSPPGLPAEQSVPGHLLAADAGAVARARLEPGLKAKEAIDAPPRQAAAWPTPGTATVTAGTAGARIGGLPLRVAAAGTGGFPDQADQVTASVVPQGATAAAGVRGVLLALSAAGGSLAPVGGKVRVRLGYSGFAGKYGGGWGSRLRLVELPRCALTTPGAAACRVQHPVATANDGATQTLTATVTLSPAASPAAARPLMSGGSSSGVISAQPFTTDTLGSDTVLAAVSGPSGADGDYTATPMLSSGTWAAQQGDFTYQYPVTVPPSLGGSAPQVTLGYDSQSIDAETSAANTQGGWIGDGWNYSPGSIEWSYQPCSQDGIADSGDDCWAGYNAVLTLNGHTGPLVKDDATGTWHLQGDDGTTVQLETGAANGLWDGEYWVVTTTDGTRYYFGLNHLPGTASGGVATNSAWGVPVYTPHSGDPCYSAASGASSNCANMGWQWNLDYVVDPLGNLTAYHYAAETGYYEMGGGQNGGTGTLTEYDRSGYPTSIAYGWLLSDAVGGASPAAQVLFTSSDRCTSTTVSTCTANENGTYWPDVPWDLNCGSSGSCTNYSPTFWITQMLTSITTEVLASSGGTTYDDVDGYALDQCDTTSLGCFPSAGGSDSVIFLNSITRTGEDGGSMPLPATTFWPPQEMDNRVDGLVPAASPVDRPRIATISTATGAAISVTYATSACSRVNGTMPAAADTNTMPCFPVYWTPPGASQIEDWFNKSLVSQIIVSDATGAATDTGNGTGDSSGLPAGDYGSPAQVTSYYYQGGAAWHQNESPVVPSGQRTWDQYRGYAQVEVTTGTPSDPVTETEYTYMRGMNGDPLTSGTATVKVADSLSDPSLNDDDWLAGQVLETDTYTAAGGTADKKVVNGPWVYGQTASQAQPDGAATLTGHMLQESTSRTLELLKSGAWGTDTTSTYDNGDALVSAVDVNPEGSTETCTTTAYASPPAGNPMMLDYPKQVTTVTGAAAGGLCPAAAASDIVSDTAYYYDNPASTVASLGSPGVLASPGGLLTGVAKADTWNGAEHWVPQSATAYDEYGRVTSSSDGNGNVTKTAYAPATGALPTSTIVTNARGWATATTTLDPGRQLPVKVTDQNGNFTTEAYDPLGRLTTVTTPLDQASGKPTYKFLYSVDGTASAPAVTTETLREDGMYNLSVSIYDGMGQLRQVQQTPADNQPGMVVTDTFYNTDGWVDKTSGPYYTTSVTAPSATMFQPYDDSSVPSQTVTTYDGQGRPTVSALWSDGSELWETDTAYPGMDETDVSPPSKTAPTTTITNILGQLTQTWQYHAGSADGAASDADVTAYTYDAAGRVQSVTAPDGNTTGYVYDLLGRETSVSSPDSGTTGYTYDAAGNVLTSTTARGTIAYAYDNLNRKTAEYAGSTSGTELASWAYDTKALGQPYSSTSYDLGAQSWAETETVTGYNAAYEPTGTSTTVPSSAGFGPGPFTTAAAYTPLTGLLASTAYSADDGLPAETVGYDYDLGGLPVSSGGAAAYTADTLYNAFGQLARETLGSRPDQVTRTYQLDPATGRVETATTNLQTVGSAEQSSFAPSDTVNYTYDDAGLVTSESDVQGSGGSQLACFSYDDLGQLKTAWTDTGAQDWTDAAGSDSSPVGPGQSVPSGGVGGCANATPSASSIGGPDPYWESYQYNGDGDRTLETTAAAPWAAADDVTQQLAYPAAGAGSGSSPADAPSQVVTTADGSAGSVTTTPSYDGAGDVSGQDNVATGMVPSVVPPAARGVAYTLAGQVASVTLPGTAGTASYQYDADGNLVYQDDPTSGSKLYLDGGAEELTLSSAGTPTGYRFYGAPDGSTVVRTTAAAAAGTGDGAGAVSDDLADQQGTATQEIMVAPAGGLAESRRYFDPYGNQVSSPVAWGDNKGFVGDPVDPDTALDLLGARAYDPVTGGFWSPDPVYLPGTLSAGGYAYAADDPATQSDPAGLCPTGPMGEPLNCNGTPVGSGTPAGGGGGGGAGRDQGQGYLPAGLRASYDGWLPSFRDANPYSAGATQVLDSLAVFCGSVDYGACPDSLFRMLIGDWQGIAAKTMAVMGATLGLGGIGREEEAGGPGAPDLADVEEIAAQEDLDGLNCGESFAAGTLVLLGSGAAVPISSLRPGEKVLATNVKTGRTAAQTVAAVLVRHDTDLYDLTVKSRGRTEIIHTTANHLFWDPYPHYGWIPANHLKPGMHLKTPDGKSAVVVGGSVPAEHDGWMWDLTVPGNNDHDFYVLAGATPVLVHNSSPGCELGPDGWPKPTMDNCEACAQKIQDKIGGEIYQISDSMGAPRLGPSVNDPNGQWFEHFAVVKDGTAYDAFTGSRGMPLDEYRSQWDYGEYLKFTPYNPGG